MNASIDNIYELIGLIVIALAVTIMWRGWPKFITINHYHNKDTKD